MRHCLRTCHDLRRGGASVSNSVRWSKADLDAHNAKQDAFRAGVKRVVAERELDQATPKVSKHRNKKCVIDSLTFDSLKEGRRYVALKHMQMSGQIFGLEVQYELPCFVKGQTICVYRCDFRYRTAASVDSGYTYEDVKGRKMRDAVFVIKRKLVSALYDITILET